MPELRLPGLLKLLGAGHDSAREPLLEHSFQRLRLLTSQMFNHYNDLRRFSQTDDVFQRAMVRLSRALQSVKPPDVNAFFGLAARQIRWVLRDLADEAATWKQVNGAQENGPCDRSSRLELVAAAEGPEDLAQWADFHRIIEKMPDEKRAMFDLLFYQGLEQADAADLLGVSLRTVKRRWQRARLWLYSAMQGEPPPFPGEKS